MSKEIQFELWQECNSRCTYCSLGVENICTPKNKKLESLRKTYETISVLTSGQYDVIGLIGGEFFQGQLNDSEVHVSFIKLIEKIHELLQNNCIKTFWLNATMTIGNQKDLWEVLDILEDVRDKVWILTSFDTEGRFHNPKMLDTWINSMNYLKTNYPEIHINTTSIITGNFIDMYLSDNLDFTQFKDMYKTSIFLKTPVKPDHWKDKTRTEINKLLGFEFFPTRQKFLNFLYKYKEKEGQTAYDNLFSNELKAGEVHKNYNDDKLRDVKFTRTKDYKETLDCDPNLKYIDTLKCGHSNIYNCYIDCDGCSICDKILISDI